MNVAKRNSTIVVGFAVMTLVVMTMLATINTIAPILQAKAQSPPISVVGNPHGFSTGPPIPSCNAKFNQGLPNDPLKGCKFTP